MFRNRGESQHDISSFENFLVDLAHDIKEDPHVEPYSPYITRGTHIVRWNFKRLSEKIGSPIERANSEYYFQENRPEWTEKAREAFYTLYGDDFDLFWPSR